MNDSIRESHILADPDSIRTGTTFRPIAIAGVCIGFERAGRFAGQLTPISTASMSICCNVDLFNIQIEIEYSHLI